MKQKTDFIFLGSKITADGDYSHEIKRHLLLGRKAMTNLDSLLKSRDITLPTKVCLVKTMVFPVVMYPVEFEERPRDCSPGHAGKEGLHLAMTEASRGFSDRKSVV